MPQPGIDGAQISETGLLGVFLVTGVTVDPPNIGAVASGTLTVSLPNVAVGDIVLGIPPNATFTAGLAVQTCEVTANNTVTIRITNASAGAIDGAALAWSFLVFKRTQRA